MKIEVVGKTTNLVTCLLGHNKNDKLSLYITQSFLELPQIQIDNIDDFVATNPVDNKVIS